MAPIYNMCVCIFIASKVCLEIMLSYSTVDAIIENCDKTDIFVL